MINFLKEFCEFFKNSSSHESYFEGMEGFFRMVFFMFVIAIVGGTYLIAYGWPTLGVC
jgi:hypothetical protein